MPGSDVLTVIAEIGVALAGFSGIVVALRQRSITDWSAPELLRFRAMLFQSAATFLFALLPFVPYHLGASSDFVWSASSLALAVLLAFILIVATTRNRPDQAGLSFPWWAAYISGTVFALSALLANAGGLFDSPGVGLYLVGIAWLLFYATTLFVRLVLAPFAIHRGSSER